MDTIEQYIMMSDCPEMQDGWIPKEGDWFTYWLDDPFDGKPRWSRRLAISRYKPINREGYNRIWLRRPDQLQAMVTDTIDCPSHSSCAILINFGNRLHELVKEDFDYWISFTSMDQLWLAFVQHELHQKKWTGESWNG